MQSLHLTVEENKQIDRLLNTLLQRYKSPSEESFLLMASTYALHLPERLLLAVNRFRYTDDHNGTFLLRGFHIDDAKLGETPCSVGREIDEFSAIREGFMLMLVISLVGDAFGWSSQRDGALINNVLPVRSHEGEQLSTGSTVDLDWHTEEAFHPYRADYLALMCLRNHDEVPTLVGSIQDIRIDDVIKKILFSPRFIFHVDKNFQNGMFDNAVPEPVLFGDYNAPYVKIDPSFMAAAPGDDAARYALEEITTAFTNSMSEIVLQQGDILFMDNYRVVHGRKAFTPRFDGTDRWLKRVNVTVDLRKSRAMRKAHNSRIIITN
jgi:Fe(II)/alpha-ketoglutarate-dependent arginine beta-hydroxylase